MGACMCTWVHKGISPQLPYLGPENRSWVIKLGSKGLYPLCHLASCTVCYLIWGTLVLSSIHRNVKAPLYAFPARITREAMKATLNLWKNKMGAVEIKTNEHNRIWQEQQEKNVKDASSTWENPKGEITKGYAKILAGKKSFPSLSVNKCSTACCVWWNWV